MAKGARELTFPITYYSQQRGEAHANLRGQATNGNRMTNPTVRSAAKSQLLESPLQGNLHGGFGGGGEET
jgi:hypothetical protein